MKPMRAALSEAAREFPIGTRVSVDLRGVFERDAVVVAAAEYDRALNERGYITEGGAFVATPRRYIAGLGGPYIALRYDDTGKVGNRDPHQLTKLDPPQPVINVLITIIVNP